ncbi:MAG: hypothetical protein K9M07_02865 [Simkaniaceae bacterium]|nr:hypothetical protein [Simkaniaceae bacterium]
MRFHFFAPLSPPSSGLGDQIAIKQIAMGLSDLKHEVTISENISEVIEADIVFLSNVYLNLNAKLQVLTLLNKPFHLIPFYEDTELYLRHSMAFFTYHALQINMPFESYCKKFHFPIYDHNQINQPALAAANSIFVNSVSEKRSILKKQPHHHIHVIPWSPGQILNQFSENFPSFCSLDQQSYILQVGRLEPRKNQIASILATRDIAYPLVLVATHLFENNKSYANTCIELAKQTRRSPVIILSMNLPSLKTPNLHIISLKAPLSTQLLMSAYQHAALNLHPAFYELPGFTTLESAGLGIPTIATEWSTLKDYFLEDDLYTLDDRIEYIEPTNIKGLETLINKKLGTKYPISNHPIYRRTYIDVAKDFLAAFSF